jgi:hypothetical protein
VGERSFNEPLGRETTPPRRCHRRGRHHRPRVSSGPLHPTPATTTSPKNPKRPETAGGRTTEDRGTFFIRSGGEVGGLHIAPTPTATSPSRRPRSRPSSTDGRHPPQGRRHLHQPRTKPWTPWFLPRLRMAASSHRPLIRLKRIYHF